MRSIVFDPDTLVPASDPNYKPLFYSNNVLYWTDDDGRAMRVTTNVENAPVLGNIRSNH